MPLPGIHRGKRPETIQLGKAWAKDTVLSKQVLRYARVPRAPLRMTSALAFEKKEERRTTELTALRDRADVEELERIKALIPSRRSG